MVMRSRLMHWISFGSLGLAALFTVACAPAQARRGTAPATALRSSIADLCGGLRAELSFLDAGGVEQALVLTEDQSAKFTSLKEASKRAQQHLRDNCPTDNPVTPPARAAATEQQLQSMFEAVRMVKPGVEDFYGSLTDDQKAHLSVTAK
jgi:LTXXQ motif family protein